MGRGEQSRLSWLCFQGPYMIPDRKNSCQKKVRCFEKCPPFVLTSLPAAGDDQHVEITHQMACQVRVRIRDQWRQYEFDHQQTAVRRTHAAAVLENPDCPRVPTPVCT